MVDRSSPPTGPGRPPLSAASLTLRLTGIAVVVAALAGAFAYVNGTLDPQRLTPKDLVNVLEKKTTACTRDSVVTTPKACA